MRVNQKKIFIIILVALLAMTIISAAPLVNARYKRGRSPYVSYRGRRTTSKGTKYYYRVYSGYRSQKIKYWYLKSSAFRYYDVVQSSESYKQYGTKLVFPKDYKSCERRRVSFTLGKEYTNPGLGCIRYKIRTRYSKRGWIKGPVRAKT